MFEEEDFQPLAYGFRLGSDISEQKALTAIKESEEDLIKQMKNLTGDDATEETTQKAKVKCYARYYASGRL